MKHNTLKRSAALTLALAALAEPALAVTNITKCQTITQPGSYRLANNLTGTGTCLMIKANQVTLDLNGHVVSGNGTRGNGISDARGQVGVQVGITVRNGTIIGFTSGVVLTFTQNAVVEGLEVGDNTAEGIFLLTGRAEANTVYDNGGTGIAGSEAITAKNNLVLDNGGNGIFGGPASILTDNLVAGNANGILARGNLFGTVSTGNAIVRGNMAAGHEGTGISVSCPALVIGNAAGENLTANLITFGSGCIRSGNLPAQ